MFGATVSTPLPLLLEVPLRLRLGLRLVPRYRYCLEFRARYSIVYVFTYNNFLKIRVYGSTANNAVSLARPILLNEGFLVDKSCAETSYRVKGRCRNAPAYRAHAQI